MLADLSIIPIGGNTHTSALLADILNAIESSGVSYQLTPTTTCLEGSWEEVVGVAQRCHEIARRKHDHIVTQLRIEDDANAGRKLQGNVDSVQEKAGREFRTNPRSRSPGKKRPEIVSPRSRRTGRRAATR